MKLASARAAKLLAQIGVARLVNSVNRRTTYTLSVAFKNASSVGTRKTKKRKLQNENQKNIMKK